MNTTRALLIRIGVFFLIVIAAIIIAYQVMQDGRDLPVLSPNQINEELVDSTMQDVQSGHRIADFELLDQHGDTITHKDLEGKVTVVNFFFTSCQGICPEMNGNIEEVAGSFEGNEKVQFFSHTVDPSYDTVDVLAEYAEGFEHTGKQWHFLTGPKKAIYKLARRSYFAVRSEGEGDESDFIHTENVILVDGKGRLRGYYDGTLPEDMERLEEGIRILLSDS